MGDFFSHPAGDGADNGFGHGFHGLANTQGGGHVGVDVCVDPAPGGGTGGGDGNWSDPPVRRRACRGCGDHDRTRCGGRGEGD